MRLTFLSLLLPLVATGPYASHVKKAEPTIDEVCTQIACRPAGAVRLKDKNKELFEVDLPRAPYVYENVVNVVAGETVLINGTQTAKGLTQFVRAQDPALRASAISISLEQVPDGVGMMMTIRNPLEKTIKYGDFDAPAHAPSMRA